MKGKGLAGFLLPVSRGFSDLFGDFSRKVIFLLFFTMKKPELIKEIITDWYLPYRTEIA